MSARWAIAIAGALAAGAAQAGDFTVHGYADLRLVSPAGERSWLDGGLGKTRYGESDVVARLAEAVLAGRWQMTEDIAGAATLRYEPEQRTALDLLDAYIRYRPVSTTPLRWSVKLGAFFPPISLENDGIGWTSPWTLTPSAINTWVGEELRAIGAEGKLEWRYQGGELGAVASVYGWNDPAGVLIADRGWAMHDRPTGLNERVRVPDAFAIGIGAPVPFTEPMFKEIDDRAGWYAGLAWNDDALGRARLLHYDNEADPAAFDEVFAWRTEFDSAGFETGLDGIVLIGQGIAGETEIRPAPNRSSLTEFNAVFLLAAKDFGEWHLAGRADYFDTANTRTVSGVSTEGKYREHGSAFTLALTWLPEEWVRVTGEILAIHSYRPQRLDQAPEAGTGEVQIQLSIRLLR